MLRAVSKPLLRWKTCSKVGACFVVFPPFWVTFLQVLKLQLDLLHSISPKQEEKEMFTPKITMINCSSISPMGFLVADYFLHTSAELSATLF